LQIRVCQLAVAGKGKFTHRGLWAKAGVSAKPSPARRGAPRACRVAQRNGYSTTAQGGNQAGQGLGAPLWETSSPKGVR
jgi:hypothetical protein